MITLRTLLVRTAIGLLALFVVACAAAQPTGLSAGMTPDQTVQAMGEPDLKDAIPDPNHSGASVTRYVWLQPGKAAIFGTDNRVASVQAVETDTQQHVEQQAHAEAAVAQPEPFDPIETPLNYLFYPAKAATIYFGAGLTCATGGGCEKPPLPGPSAS
ncbi:MAG: hypothetical protein ABSD30_09320 [Candidatus Binatus sp.]